MGNCCTVDGNAIIRRNSRSVPRSTKTTERSSSQSGMGPIKSSPLSESDLQERISAPSVSIECRIGEYMLRYAYVSQRGYYPDDLKKANQDAFSISTSLAGDESQALFAVYDGHGSHGDRCVQFVKDKLPEVIEEHLKRADGAEMADILRLSHCKVNYELHASSVDDNMSGTTAISVLFRENEIHVSNVGDSRAIIAQEVTKRGEKMLVCKPLSIDQTPFRRDERMRVKRTGARVMTVDQLDGIEPIHENWGVSLGEELDESGDPPRIWHPYGDYPGTAFTRSIGDAISEELGVIPDPELLSKKLNKDDRFIIIASDGVFEFLTSQSVVDMVKEYDDPLEACSAVVQEAYNRWLQYEVRTDDITMICIFLEGITATRDNMRGSVYSGAEIMDMESMQRPVRGFGNAMGNKRDTILGTDSVRISLTQNGSEASQQEEQEFDLQANVVPKSEEDKHQIREIVKSNFLFKKVTEAKLQEIIAVMSKKCVEAGDVIIEQGDVGDFFYIISFGEFEVRVKGSQDQDQDQSTTKSLTDKFGPVVHVYESQKHSKLHASFGDLALIHSKPRAATVVARRNGELWALSKQAFHSVLASKPRKGITDILRNLEIMKALTLAQVQRLSEELVEEEYSAGDVIVKEGDSGDTFYLLMEGEVKCVKERGENESNEVVAELVKHQYFGEKALLNNEPRAVSVIAKTNTTCLCIGRKEFERSFGKLSAVVEKDCERRKKMQWIQQCRDNTPANEFAQFSYDAPNCTSKSRVYLNDIECIATIVQHNESSIRLVTVSVPDQVPRRMTLKSFSKQTIVQLGMQNHVVGEQSTHICLDPSAGIPALHLISMNDRNIHFLYNEVLVAPLEKLLEETQPNMDQVLRFVAAQVILILEGCHKEGILCRAIDPSMLLVDENGYLKLISLGNSKYVGTGRTYTICGTPEYLSPEQVAGSGHDLMTDLWSFGVLMYEMLTSKTPFSPKDGEPNGDLDVFKRIADFNTDSIDFDGVSDRDGMDLIKGLLQHDREKRLGFRDVINVHESEKFQQLRGHAIFKDMNWKEIETRSTKSPLDKQASQLLSAMLATEEEKTDLTFGEKYDGDNSVWNQF